MSAVDDASETEDYSWWRGHSGGGRTHAITLRSGPNSAS